MKVKFILPALTEAESPFWRPIKYSLFPPLGLATLAAFLGPDDEAELVDAHIETVRTDDLPDLVVIQVYITNAYRAYALADLYRAKGCFVALGGLHVTSFPEEAAPHADAIFVGPGEQTFPRFLADLKAGRPRPRYDSGAGRTVEGLPPIRRDLIKRRLYLVPNSIVVTRAVRNIATSATRTPSSRAAEASTPSVSTRRWPRSSASPAATSTSSTTTCSATAASPKPCSTGCGAWAGCSRAPQRWIPCFAAT